MNPIPSPIFRNNRNSSSKIVPLRQIHKRILRSRFVRTCGKLDPIASERKATRAGRQKLPTLCFRLTIGSCAIFGCVSIYLLLLQEQSLRRLSKKARIAYALLSQPRSHWIIMQIEKREREKYR